MFVAQLPCRLRHVTKLAEGGVTGQVLHTTIGRDEYLLGVDVIERMLFTALDRRDAFDAVERRREVARTAFAANLAAANKGKLLDMAFRSSLRDGPS